MPATVSTSTITNAHTCCAARSRGLCLFNWVSVYNRPSVWMISAVFAVKKQSYLLFACVFTQTASMLAANRKAIQHKRTHFVPFTWTQLNLQTYAVVVCMSCQPLLKLFLSSLRGLMPSFCLRSACCFSLDDKTCFSVLISSSSWTYTKKDEEREREKT